MNGYDLLEAAGGIRPEFIEEGLAGGKGGRTGSRGIVLPAAAALVFLCISLAGISALAAPGYAKGLFRDIFGIGGAVTGTVYEAGEEEALISASWSEGKLIIDLRAADGGALPWRELETIRLKKYCITDGSGKILLQGEDPAGTGTAVFREGKARIEAGPDSSPKAPCTLVIEEMERGKKGDAPLLIKGRWECPVDIY